MRKIVLIFSVLILAGLFACDNGSKNKIPADVVSNPNSATGKESKDLPAIVFERDIYDFGKLIDGETAVYNFKFKNTGTADLLISQVNSSCGCTVPKFPKEPIPPGGEGYIKVSFDSSGRTGVQNKAVTVVSNCQPNQTVIRIKAMVLKP